MTHFDALLDIDHHLSGGADETWREMRRDGGVHWHEPGKFPGFWSITRYDDARAVYADAARFSSARGVLLRRAERGGDPGAGLSLALTDSPRHRALRAVMAAHFGNDAVRALRNLTEARARQLLHPLRDGASLDASHDVAARLAFEITCAIIGYPDDTVNAMFRWSLDAYSRGSSLAANRDWVLLTAELIDRCRTTPSGSLLSTLVCSIDGRGQPLLSTEEVLLNCENLIGATENAGLSLATGIALFCDHPDQWQHFRAEPRLRRGAIDEILRVASSARHSLRTATRDTEIGGRAITRDDPVVLWLPSANRDESVFEAPDRFDITRTTTRHLALGSGEHTCIGALLARLEMESVLACFLAFDGSPTRAGPERQARSLAVSGPVSLPVRIA